MYKRFEMRRSAGVPIEVISSSWDIPVHLLASDLSPRGTYLETEFMPDTGEHMVLCFDLGSKQEEYCFFGEVTRVNMMRRKNELGRPGFGVNFLDATPFDRLKIRQALRGCPPPVPAPRRDGQILHAV